MNLIFGRCMMDSYVLTEVIMQHIDFFLQELAG